MATVGDPELLTYHAG
jgi:predicted transcriptional regulator